jgi:hypothetical protein
LDLTPYFAKKFCRWASHKGIEDVLMLLCVITTSPVAAPPFRATGTKIIIKNVLNAKAERKLAIRTPVPTNPISAASWPIYTCNSRFRANENPSDNRQFQVLDKLD